MVEPGRAAALLETARSPLVQGLTSLRYRHGIPILDMRSAMGSVALTDKPIIWSFVEGELLVGLRDNNHHTLFGFLSHAAIRAMLRQEWLRREGPYLHVTDAGREVAVATLSVSRHGERAPTRLCSPQWLRSPYLERFLCSPA